MHDLPREASAMYMVTVSRHSCLLVSSWQETGSGISALRLPSARDPRELLHQLLLQQKLQQLQLSMTTEAESCVGAASAAAHQTLTRRASWNPG